MGRKFFDILTPQELEQLKQAQVERNQKTYQRNNLIFDFLFYSGLRQFNPSLNNYLFTNQKKQPLSPLVIRQIIQQRLKKAGIDKPITPHSFRRSFATHLHNKKAHLTTIQMLLGHESITTTEKYIHNDFDYIYADYSKLPKKVKQKLGLILDCQVFLTTSNCYSTFQKDKAEGFKGNLESRKTEIPLACSLLY
ncbi:2363_t:CDS:2 [Entrophospora sp. SA101]|nr:2363_t:CDS:2 [Entrophospora sp. SA101]